MYSYVDADFAGCLATRRSTSGLVCFFGRHKKYQTWLRDVVHYVLRLEWNFTSISLAHLRKIVVTSVLTTHFKDIWTCSLACSLKWLGPRNLLRQVYRQHIFSKTSTLACSPASLKCLAGSLGVARWNFLVLWCWPFSSLGLGSTWFKMIQNFLNFNHLD